MAKNMNNTYDLSPIRDDTERVNKPLLEESGASPRPAAGDALLNGDQVNLNVVVHNPTQETWRTVKDKYFLVYGIFLLFGVATLLPWNIFITASAYFDNKLDTNTSSTANYRTNFTYYVGCVGQITNVIMNIINIAVTFGGNPKNRIPYTIMLCASVIVFQIILAIINTETWPLAFFILCCASVFVMYIATGIFSSCVYFVATIFPMEYMNAIILGSNLSGVFTTVMSIISKLTSPDPKISAIYYFLSAFVVLMLAFVGYFLMHRLEFYRHNNQLAEQKKQKAQDESANMRSSQSVPYLQIIRKIWLLLFCIWLNFFSTLAIFPVYQLGIKRSDGFFISDKWFQDIVTFLTFNVLVTIGNMIPKLVRKPGPKWIPIPVILRAVCVFGFFAVCNFKPELREKSFIPILITNDYVYWAGCIISPILFGYFTSLLMMYTPNQVPEHAGTVAMISALVLVIGVTTGLQFTKVFEWIILA